MAFLGSRGCRRVKFGIYVHYDCQSLPNLPPTWRHTSQTLRVAIPVATAAVEDPYLESRILRPIRIIDTKKAFDRITPCRCHRQFCMFLLIHIARRSRICLFIRDEVGSWRTQNFLCASYLWKHTVLSTHYVRYNVFPFLYKFFNVRWNDLVVYHYQDVYQRYIRNQHSLCRLKCDITWIYGVPWADVIFPLYTWRSRFNLNLPAAGSISNFPPFIIW